MPSSLTAIVVLTGRPGGGEIVKVDSTRWVLHPVSIPLFVCFSVCLFFWWVIFPVSILIFVCWVSNCLPLSNLDWMRIPTGYQAHALHRLSVTWTEKVFHCKSVSIGGGRFRLYCRMSSYCQVCAGSVTAPLVVYMARARVFGGCGGSFSVRAKRQVSATWRLPSHPASPVSNHDGLLQILDIVKHGDTKQSRFQDSWHFQIMEKKVQSYACFPACTFYLQMGIYIYIYT